MTTCLICKCDISKPEQQFGDMKNPMCQSDWLDDKAWVYDEPIAMELLQRGFTFDEACAIELDERNKNFQSAMQELFAEVEEIINQ